MRRRCGPSRSPTRPCGAARSTTSATPWSPCRRPEPAWTVRLPPVRLWSNEPMRRDVSAHLGLTVAGPATLLFSTAVSGSGFDVDERLTFRVDGRELQPTEFTDHYGSRLHQVECPAGKVEFDYAATVSGKGDVLGAELIDLVTFPRPSRYCESDALAPTAQAEFAGLE